MNKGISAAMQPPTWSARVDRLTGTPCVALGLPVERLMLAKLLEQHHRQQAGSGPAPRDHVEGRWRLVDLLAVPATELLTDVLDHLPRFRDDLQRLGNVLAELGQPRASTAGTSRRPWYDHAFAGQMVRGLRDGRLRVNDATVVVVFAVLAAAISAESSSSVAAVSNSSNVNSS